MGHSAVLGYVLWAIVYIEAGYTLWAVERDLQWAIVLNQLAERRSTQQVLKACHIL
jgi:hypothetical protein